MAEINTKTDVVIVGAGLAGMVAAIELLDLGKKVVLFDRDSKENMGGLARESFGGITMIGTPQQRKNSIKDSADLAFNDWITFGEIPESEIIPRKWIREYVNRSYEDIYLWLTNRGIKFFPVVHWVERGLFIPGNSVPRFHMVWGTGYYLIEALKNHLNNHPKKNNLQIFFNHSVENIIFTNGAATGVQVKNEIEKTDFELLGEAVVLASGGYCGGSMKMLRDNWYKAWGNAPEFILNGAHKFADGKMHVVVKNFGGKITHLDKQWNYAAGVHHPKPKKDLHGLSLVPPKSALWVNYQGKRLGPTPLITAFDTRYLVERITAEKKQYSWQILNWKIAKKELAVSGAEYNDAIKNRNFLAFVKSVLLGNEKLVKDLTTNCKDFVVANSIEELVKKMNNLTGNNDVSSELLTSEIRKYDENIGRGKKFHNDDQLRRITHVREYRGDRVRTCAFQKIEDKDAMPLIAIREFILARKSLGGIMTNLESKVLDNNENPIKGLFAVGETAGFGGGGIHGLRSLEGTFLGSCVFTARIAAQAIAKS
ncbi:MAG: FAD-binding dehydrogenase [Bacteriovoracaceae bacterium]